MKINIRATNLALTEAIKNYVEEKISAAEKYAGNLPITGCNVEIELTTKHHQKGDIFRAEVNLVIGKDLLRVEKTESDLYKAIDKVKDHLFDVIKKHKEKRLAKERRSS